MEMRWREMITSSYGDEKGEDIRRGNEDEVRDMIRRGYEDEEGGGSQVSLWR